jgi:hypothetical protein
MAYELGTYEIVMKDKKGKPTSAERRLRRGLEKAGGRLVEGRSG